jgi:hypothetical protein
MGVVKWRCDILNDKFGQLLEKSLLMVFNSKQVSNLWVDSITPIPILQWTHVITTRAFPYRMHSIFCGSIKWWSNGLVLRNMLLKQRTNGSVPLFCGVLGT